MLKRLLRSLRRSNNIRCFKRGEASYLCISEQGPHFVDCTITRNGKLVCVVTPPVLW